MTALHKPRPGNEPRSSYRVYRDPEPTDTAFCRLVGSDENLIRLGAGINRIEIRQAPGAGWIPSLMTERVVETLRGIILLNGSNDPRAERMEREMRRRLADSLARIRIRCNRRLLAGIVAAIDGSERVLVLVFTGPGIASCEWHLAMTA